MDRSTIYATATLVGTIVGAGMFGIPYVVAQSGFLIGAVFLFILTIVSILLHLAYGEIAYKTPGKHRLVGYAEHYLGKYGKVIVTISLLIGFFGSLLVYIIISGEFLSELFSPLFGGSSFVYSLIFFAIGSLGVLKGLKLIEQLELVIGLLLCGIVLLIFFSGIFHLDVSNLKSINLKQFFLPYGVILWALAGGAAVPELKEVVKGNGKSYKKAIVLGTLIPAVLYFLFMFVVVGVSGGQTSPEAIQGLTGILGKEITYIGAAFGALASITSFFVIGLALKKVFWYDYRINKNLSWFLVCFIPLLGFLLGLREFIPIIGFLGVFLGAIESVSIILIYKKVSRIKKADLDYNLKLPKIVIFSLIVLFILGFIYQIIYYVA